MTMQRHVLAIAIALLSAGPAWAHGPSHGASGQDAHSGHGTAAAAAYGVPGDPVKPSRDVVVKMLEADGKMLFVPSYIEARRGEQIRFQFENAGDLAHEFLLGTAAEIEEHADLMKAMPDMKHDDPNSRQVAAKAKADLVWQFTQAGEFDFACLIPGHREAGMTGKIVVK